MKTWGIGIVGCGTIAQFHIQALKEVPQARLVGVSGRRAEKAREVGEREKSSWTADYKELLRNPEVEVVSVTTSSGSHAPIAIEALAAGKHVLVEKPMSMTAAQADRMIAKASEKRLTLGVISQRRFEDPHQAAKRAIDGGALGKLLLVEAYCPFYRTQEYYDSASWRGTKAEDGGALMNQGIHSVDLLLWFGGRARSVSGKTATRTHRMEAEDLGLGLVTFESGAFGTIMASTSIQPGFAAALNLYGEKGTIKIEGTSVVHWTVPGVAKPELQDASASGAGVRDPKAISHRYHRRQIEDFLAAVVEGRPPAVTGEDGKRAVQLIEGIYASSETGAPVKLG